MAAHTAAIAPARPPRQFDFWIGDWEVVDSAGRLLGTNQVTRAMGGCVVHEHWTGGGGNTGESFNIYRRGAGHRRGAGQRHQSWVDSGGNLLLLEGGLEGGVMVLRAELPAPSGGTQLHRISYTPLEAGRVRQFWEVSGDGGKTWRATFDGYYRRRVP